MPTDVYAPINTLKQVIAGVWIVVTEVVVLHAATRTLLLTDLLENFETRKLASYLARLLTNGCPLVKPGMMRRRGNCANQQPSTLMLRNKLD
jgi:hypothetical protein